MQFGIGREEFYYIVRGEQLGRLRRVHDGDVLLRGICGGVWLWCEGVLYKYGNN